MCLLTKMAPDDATILQDSCTRFYQASLLCGWLPACNGPQHEETQPVHKGTHHRGQSRTLQVELRALGQKLLSPSAGRYISHLLLALQLRNFT